MEANITSEIIEKERLAAIGEIVVTVNHNINNPLTTIINYAELLQAIAVSDDQAKVLKGIKKILDAALKIKKVTHSLAAIESSRKVPYLEEINMIAIPDDLNESTNEATIY